MTADSTSFVILRYLFDNLVTTLQKNTYKEPGRKQPFLIKAKQKEVNLGFSWEGEWSVHIWRENTWTVPSAIVVQLYLPPPSLDQMLWVCQADSASQKDIGKRCHCCTKTSAFPPKIVVSVPFEEILVRQKWDDIIWGMLMRLYWRKNTGQFFLRGFSKILWRSSGQEAASGPLQAEFWPPACPTVSRTS